MFLSRWKPFDGTKGHKHPEYKRIKNLNKSLENQKELENHLKTYRTLKNQKKLEKTNKTKKNKKTNKTKKNKKNNCQGVLVKHPNFLKSLEFLFFLFFLVFWFYCFFWFSRCFFVFFGFLEVFCVAAANGFSPPPPPFSLSKELFSRPRSL